MKTGDDALRKYAPFINGTIMRLYRELGFRVVLKSGRTGLRILPYKKIIREKGPTLWGGEILVDSVINAELTKLGFAKLSLWAALSELEFLRKNTDDTNFSKKVKDFFESGKISEETYDKARIDDRMATMETLSTLRKFARNRKVAYILEDEFPFATYVHEKLHEVCQRISKIGHGSRREHDYIEVVTPYVLLVLMQTSNKELRKFVNKELKEHWGVSYMLADGWPKQIGQIMELYSKKKIKNEDGQELMRSVTYAQLMEAMDKIISKYS